jgi:uncharacterized protein YqeY
VLEERMRRDLTAAMKERDRARITVLRTALAAIANAEAPVVDTRAWPPPVAGSTEVERLELTDADRQRVISAQIVDREDTVAQYERNGRTAEADVVRSEIAILRTYQE